MAWEPLPVRAELEHGGEGVPTAPHDHGHRSRGRSASVKPSQGCCCRTLDLDAGRIRVDQSLTYVAGRGPSLGPPKSEAAYRTVSLPSTTREILQAHVNTYGYHDRYSLVFTTVTGKLLLNRYFAPFWRRAKANADVDPAVRFHDLRHLAGTTAASAGASLREIMTRMG
jgi:integrase